MSRTASLLSLPPELWKGLMALAKPVQAERHQVLFHVGDEGTGCYVVQTGALKAVVLTPDGGERMIAIFNAGSIVGELALFDEEPRSATVVAVRPSKLAYLSKETFFRFADNHPQVYRHVLKVLSQRLRGTTEDVVAQRKATVAARVARALLKLGDGLGEASGTGPRRIGQRVSQSDIAAMAGVARENASRAINAWLKSGLISRQDGCYCLEDPEALEDIALELE